MNQDRKNDIDAAEPVEIVINGVLDLHAFSPKDLKHLIPDYIEECLFRDIMEIRIVHGKGKGNIRRSVHALLQRNSAVVHFSSGDETTGSWGATIVQLEKN